MHSQMRVFFTWFQNDRRELGLVGRIRVMLGFEAETIVLIVDSAFTLVGAIKEVSGIKLDSGLGGEYFHEPSCFRFVNGGSKSK